jgi:hypothetical protein
LRAERVDAAAELSRLRGIVEQLRSSVAGAETELGKREENNAKQSAEITALVVERLRLITEVCELMAQARALRSSRSWRLTSPLRGASTLARRLLGRPPSSQPAPTRSPVSSTPDFASPSIAQSGAVATPPGGDDHPRARLGSQARIILNRLEAAAKLRSAARDA